MQKFRVWPLILWLSLLSSLAFHQPVLGADATSFDPTRVEVKAKGAGIPVGMIFAWPVGQNPEDMDNWLECNGQSISRSVYPELFAVIGSQTPDLRGLFLRGHGGNSAALGSIQQGTLPEHKHAVEERLNWVGYVGGGYGAFVPLNNASGYTTHYSGPAIQENSGENRPTNRAVRYLIRARQ